MTSSYSARRPESARRVGAGGLRAREKRLLERAAHSGATDVARLVHVHLYGYADCRPDEPPVYEEGAR